MYNLPIASEYWTTNNATLWRPSWCQNNRLRRRHRKNNLRYKKGLVFYDTTFKQYNGDVLMHDELEYEGGPTFRVVGRTQDENFILERNNVNYVIPFDGVMCLNERERFDVPMGLIEEGTVQILEKVDDKHWKIIFNNQEYYTVQDLSDEGLYDSSGKIHEKMMRLTGDFLIHPIIRGGVTPKPIKFEM